MRTRIFKITADVEGGLVVHECTVAKTTRSRVWVRPSESTGGKSTVRFAPVEGVEDSVDAEWAWTLHAAACLFIRSATAQHQENLLRTRASAAALKAGIDLAISEAS